MPSTKSLFFLFVLGALFFEADPHAIAASFDCGKAASTTERPTYENAQISALDDKLQQAYKAAQATAAPSSKKTLIEEQCHWITYTRDVCQDETCLQQAYTAHIAALARNGKYIIDNSSCEPSGNGSTCVNVATYRVGLIDFTHNYC